MGLFGELDAAATAEHLEAILLDSLKSENWSNLSVIAFAKKHLYPWYLNECSEGFVKANPEIIKAFE